jgi:hypothetical protein
MVRSLKNSLVLVDGHARRIDPASGLDLGSCGGPGAVTVGSEGVWGVVVYETGRARLYDMATGCDRGSIGAMGATNCSVHQGMVIVRYGHGGSRLYEAATGRCWGPCKPLRKRLGDTAAP